MEIKEPLEPVLKDTLGGVEIKIPRRVGGCANCAVLVEEVAQLKKRLAAANREMVGVTVSVGANDEAGARYQMAPVGEPCIHGGVVGACRKLGCRAK